MPRVGYMPPPQTAKLSPHDHTSCSSLGSSFGVTDAAVTPTPGQSSWLDRVQGHHATGVEAAAHRRSPPSGAIGTRRMAATCRLAYRCPRPAARTGLRRSLRHPDECLPRYYYRRRLRLPALKSWSMPSCRAPQSRHLSALLRRPPVEPLSAALRPFASASSNGSLRRQPYSTRQWRPSTSAWTPQLHRLNRPCCRV